MPSYGLVIGIDYLHTKRPLTKCVDAARRVANFLLSDLGYTDVSVYTEQETPSRVTYNSLVTSLWELAIDSYVRRLDHVWIHFSGYGTTSPDREAIRPVDYLTAGNLLDDELTQILDTFNPSTHVICVVDTYTTESDGVVRYTYTKQIVDTICRTERSKHRVIAGYGCRSNHSIEQTSDGTNEFSGGMTPCVLHGVRQHVKPMLVGIVNVIRRRLNRCPIMRQYR
jgi:hypothetical protein